MTAIISMLAQYPREVIDAVTDPLRGLPSRLDWLPTLREVREACEREMEPIRREDDRQKRLADTRMMLAAPERPRPSYDDLRAKYGPSFGLSGDCPGKVAAKPLTEDEMRERFAAMPGPSEELAERVRAREAAE